MNWIDVTVKLPTSISEYKTINVVMIDVDAGLQPILGWYDHSETAGGFYTRSSDKLMRIFCTHYIELPDRPKKMGK